MEMFYSCTGRGGMNAFVRDVGIFPVVSRRVIPSGKRFRHATVFMRRRCRGRKPRCLGLLHSLRIGFSKLVPPTDSTA